MGNIGESTTHPHLRKPPCNQEAVNRVVSVGLLARSLCEVRQARRRSCHMIVGPCLKVGVQLSLC